MPLFLTSEIYMNVSGVRNMSPFPTSEMYMNVSDVRNMQKMPKI